MHDANLIFSSKGNAAMRLNVFIDHKVTLASPPGTDDETLATVRQILAVVQQLKMEFQKMNAAIESLATNVAQNSSVIDSAVLLITGLHDQLEAAIASGDMGEVQRLSDTLSGETQKLADAVAANTPAEEPPPAV